MRRAALLLAAVLASGCAPHVSAPAVPPMPVDAQERALRERVTTYADPAVTALLARVAAALLLEGEPADAVPEMIVVDDPTISAFALPTGRIYLHTGLLARLENEAQLATVLARALTHARQHAALEPRVSDARVDEALARIPATIVEALATREAERAVLSPVAEAILGARLGGIYVAAVTGYGTALEADADAGALRRLVRAGYDPKEALRAFERLRREARSGGPAEIFYLGNDAALGERLATTARLLATDYVVAASAPDTIRTSGDFDDAVAAVARDNARLELAAGRFRAAQEQLDRALAVRPGDARAHLVYGDLFRLRAQRARGAADRDELARRALDAYDRAASLDPALGEVARHVGLLYYQQGQVARALEAFTRYLTTSPDAPDAARVSEYVEALSR